MSESRLGGPSSPLGSPTPSPPPIIAQRSSRSRVPGVPSGSPLIDSYTHHSPTPSTSGKYMLGVDEAGRGPVLGPLVYGIAYCPVEYKSRLEEMGFADSKTLTHLTRETLLETLSSDPENLGWSVRVISPRAISSGMLRRPPTNLNEQSQNATILLIREVLAAGLEISELYVDALGPSVPYQAYLSSLFPTMSVIVTPKADAIYPIVGAASIAAKVTRDAWLDGWVFEETVNANATSNGTQPVWVYEDRGSGYPSDPKTQAWLKKSIDPTFGFPSIARFSWATVKVLLDKEAQPVTWIDDGQTSLIKAFESSAPREKGRSVVAKEVALKSVADL